MGKQLTAPFIGRQAELERLQGLLSKKSASIIVVRGRRRIGKSRLLGEFGKELKSFFFSGLPPIKKKIKNKAQLQRDDFVGQMRRLGLLSSENKDWADIFFALAKQTRKGRILIVLDEISWLGGKDPTFLSKLKTAWDLHFSKNPQLILAICGSISSWIEENILSSTGFLGRISIDLVLDELPLSVCNDFWHSKKGRLSAYEKFKLLAITGGVPRYLEEIRPEIPAEKMIQELCFTRGGLLVKEFEQIFSDLFAKKSKSYKEIVSVLADGPKDLTTLCQELGTTRGGIRTKHLNDLHQAGFVQKDFTWDLDTGKESKLGKFRLSDNYLRFYVKYIAKHFRKIEAGTFAPSLPGGLPGWDTIMGLQFENLVVHNRKTVWELLSLNSDEVVRDGPFFQAANSKQLGCQIDYIIETRFHTLYLCEIKFARHPVTRSVIEEVEEKRKRLKTPRNFSIRPVLIHVNGVEEALVEENYFDKIIDFAQLLQG